MLPLLALVLQAPQSFATTDLSASPNAVLRPVPAGDVKLLPGFWLERVQANRSSLRAGHEQLAKIGAFENFRVAGGKAGKHQVFVFTDSDAYKWLEAACIELALRGGDQELRDQVHGFVPLILAAMQPDGYVMTKYTIEKLPRWHNLANDHELYCMGHLIQAAVAHRRAFGDSEFFARARATADMIARTFPGEREGACGHPEIEIALVELYRETGEKRYLDTAAYFINRRGVEPQVAGGSEYMQDHVPFREQREAVGHAVRALYLYAGAADVYLETGDETLPPVLTDLWNDLHYYKTYVTGGVGARHDGEAIGARYELPNKEAYSETCAAIASVLFSQRMLCMTGDARYGDAMETALYNNILAAVSLDGSKFFYVNPLESDGGHQRKDWYACACCPPNIMRTIANIGGQFFLAKDNTLYLDLYGSAQIDTELPGGKRAHFEVLTGYPWDGEVRVRSLPGNECVDLAYRKPSWCHSELQRSGEHDRFQPASLGFVHFRTSNPDAVHLRVELLMQMDGMRSNPAIQENVGSVALRRGPLVYCFESVDNAAVDVLNARICLQMGSDGFGWREWGSPQELRNAQALTGVGAPAAPAAASVPAPDPLYWSLTSTLDAERSVAMKAIPYYSWANRGDSRMRIWMPVAP